MSYKNIKVLPLTHHEFLRVQLQMGAENGYRLTHDNVINELITIYHKTHKVKKS